MSIKIILSGLLLSLVIATNLYAQCSVAALYCSFDLGSFENRVQLDLTCNDQNSTTNYGLTFNATGDLQMITQFSMASTNPQLIASLLLPPSYVPEPTMTEYSLDGGILARRIKFEEGPFVSPSYIIGLSTTQPVIAVEFESGCDQIIEDAFERFDHLL